MFSESGLGGYEAPVERVELPYDDETLEAVVLQPEHSRRLYDADPVLWVRCAVGVDTGRGASFITDRELAERHSAGGFMEWDPRVAQAVATYLATRGFLGLYGQGAEASDFEANETQIALRRISFLFKYITVLK